MSALQLLHLSAVMFWIGCVATEIIVEQYGGRHPLWKLAVPDLHRMIDRWVEIPAFVTVLITGALLFDHQRFLTEGLYQLKISAGLAAVFANLFCLYPVRQRYLATEAGQEQSARRYGRWIDASALLGMPFGAIALGIGIYWLLQH